MRELRHEATSRHDGLAGVLSTRLTCAAATSQRQPQVGKHQETTYAAGFGNLPFPWRGRPVCSVIDRHPSVRVTVVHLSVGVDDADPERIALASLQPVLL